MPIAKDWNLDGESVPWDHETGAILKFRTFSHVKPPCHHVKWTRMASVNVVQTLTPFSCFERESCIGKNTKMWNNNIFSRVLLTPPPFPPTPQKETHQYQPAFKARSPKSFLDKSKCSGPEEEVKLSAILRPSSLDGCQEVLLLGQNDNPWCYVADLIEIS